MCVQYYYTYRPKKLVVWVLVCEGAGTAPSAARLNETTCLHRLPPRYSLAAITGQSINSRWRDPIELGVQVKPFGGIIGEHVKGDGRLLSADGGISNVS